jgi:two-component sensor histidine kinase
LGSKNSIVSAINDSPTKPSRAVTVLYAAMLLLALCIAALSFITDYQRTKEDLEERAEAYAISMATDVRWYADVARQTLRRAVDRFEDGTSRSAVVSEAMSDMPDGVIVVLYDAKGTSQTVMGVSAPMVNIADRPYFQQLKAGKEWVFSNLITSRQNDTKTFAIGLAIRRNGEFKGAAVAYAPMNVFQDAWLNVGGHEANVFLVHRDGWISARLPPLDSDIYNHPVEKSFVDTFTQAPTGAYWAEASPIDGISRVLGYASVPSTPLIAVLGQSPTEALNGVWHRIAVSLAVLAPILILLTYASWRIKQLLSKHEATEIQLRAALETNERFLLEIHHRVKNNLQSAQSLIRMYVRSPEIMSEIEPRIAAMAKVHEHIYRSDRLVSVTAATYLKDIAEQIIFSSANKVTLNTNIEDIDLPSDVAMPVGQLLNEAIINAVKYGFENRSDGVICIELKRTENGQAILTIHNNGAPMPSEKRQGIGSRLMPAFASQVNGSVETTSDDKGVTVVLKFPLDGLKSPA